MSNVVVSFWNGLGRGGRMAAIGAAALLMALVLWVSFTLLRQDHAVLFSDLAESDAAAIVERLKKGKVPYRLAADGTTVLVPAQQVHDLRLALMSGGGAVSGAVGFEIFDKQGLGATEHAQKVSYQRALQGELARTIGALDDVKQARVHLVMPESTLFTRDRQQASAAVAITMRNGATLDRQQIVGVQRLVAAAVPGLEMSKVVITDQRGLTLSFADTSAAGAGAADARLQVKREVEEYVTHKVARLLDSAFGPGQAIVSVDAVLNFDSSKTTIQDLLPAANDVGAMEGRIIRRRQVTGSSSNQPTWTSTADGAAAAPRTPSSSTEVEYEYGRRIDEVIAAPGAVTRMSVGVVVPGDLTEEKRARIAELVRMAAGINEGRGDAVSVQPLSQIDSLVEHADGAEATEVEPASPAPAVSAVPQFDRFVVLGAGALLFAVVLVLLLLIWRRAPRTLSSQDRQRVLEEIQRALAEEGSVAAGRAR